jgi:hypothetical protein
VPPAEESGGRVPIDADDVTLATGFLRESLSPAPADRWGNPAGELDWDCWETVEHIADDLFAYAAQLAPSTPEGGYIPIAMTSTRPDGARSAIHVEREEGADSLLRAVEACGTMLRAMVRTTPADTRAWHPYGTSDPEGFAAMGVAEALVHGYDAAQGLGVAWDPPADLCTRVLDRLFPEAPSGEHPWATLLWATGRAALADRPRLDDWRWYSEPRP